jgi:SpoVK/Ycf46/Vps4 family AAA+-type ATPase
MTTAPSKTAGAKAAAEIADLLRARNPLIWISTKEEQRAERYLIDAAALAQYDPRFWDCANGLTRYDGAAADASLTDPAAVIGSIRDTRQRNVYVLRDLHAWLRDPTVTRALRSLAHSLTRAPRAEARAVIVLSPSADIPPELQGEVITLEWPLPDREEIAQLLDAAVAALPDELRAQACQNGTREAAIDAAVGLTAEEAQACFAKSLVSTRRIEPATVATEKKRVIAREKVLEWHDPHPAGLAAIGGLDVLKAWLTERRAAFTPAARAYGLPAPKGALLVGVPGCGKSLTAKAIAAAWQMPLLRLDMGALRSKWVGESEGNIRKALRVAETVAPCILWLDEIEKAMAGATQGAADGGVSADALGAILSWLQDRAGAVFLIATANDVSALPPELMRKGRFDELFFVDLPNPTERAAILAAALKAHGREIEAQDLNALAGETQDFTGAELAALVPDALYAAFADGARALHPTDLLRSAQRTVPLAKTSAERIEALRRWSKGRARNASTQEKRAETTGARTVDLG